MRTVDSFTLHQEARRLRSKEIGRIAGAAFATLCGFLAAQRGRLRARVKPRPLAGTRLLDLA